jgi:hypothetical protein
MKLLRCSYNHDALDAYFDPATRIVYAVRTWRRDKFDVCAFDATRDEDDQRIFASLSVDFATEAEALTELNRIAALISGEAAPAPSVGRVPGPPPEDGEFYLVQYGDEFNDLSPGVARFNSGQAEYVDDDNLSYADGLITHHNPTPISLEIP